MEQIPGWRSICPSAQWQKQLALPVGSSNPGSGGSCLGLSLAFSLVQTSPRYERGLRSSPYNPLIPQCPNFFLAKSMVQQSCHSSAFSFGTRWRKELE